MLPYGAVPFDERLFETEKTSKSKNFLLFLFIIGDIMIFRKVLQAWGETVMRFSKGGMKVKYHFLRFPEGKEKALTLSYDDGHENDRRLIEIANRYGIKVTLNINSGMFGHEPYGRLTAQELKEITASGGHEIAVHGADHLALGKVAAADGIRDILLCREALEREFGRVIRGMAYAYSGITKLTEGVALAEIKTYLKSLDMAYARTLGGDNCNFSVPNDFLEWMPTAHHRNPCMMDWLQRFLSSEIPSWGDDRGARLFYLWGHSFEFERDNNWELFETFCKTAGGREDVWYATNIEICDYVKAYRALQFSLDGTRVFNPTCRTVWFETNKKLICAPAGQMTETAV